MDVLDILVSALQGIVWRSTRFDTWRLYDNNC